MEPLGREHYWGEPQDCAVSLLNKLLCVRDPSAGEVLVARIVEVEAYGGTSDLASHAAGGITGRNGSMFGPPGHLYVYFTYGMHHCINVVCGAEGIAGAVLVRAAEPVAGMAPMRRRRVTSKADWDLLSGPGRLALALGVDRGHDGMDLCDPSGMSWIASDGTPPPRAPANGPRVGITKATELAWRWWVPDSKSVSGPRRSAEPPSRERQVQLPKAKP